MRMTCLLPALLVVGCFADPPSPSGSGSGSTSADGSSGTSVASGTSTTDDEGSSGGSSSTGFGSSSTSYGSSSSGSTGDSPPEASFCTSPANATALFCTDFDDPPSPTEWPQPAAEGYNRTVEKSPPPFSAPRFMRLARNGEVPNTDAVQALFEGDDIQVGRLEGVRLRLVFRLPPDFETVCGQNPLRLFSFEYVSGEAGSPTVRLVGAVSEDSLLLTVGEDAGATVLGSYQGIHGAAMSGWRTLDVELRATSSTGVQAINVIGSAGETGPVVANDFEPLDGVIDVTVGPWFIPGFQPPEGCSYDVDDIVLLPIPQKE
jgi:hypothetical protein